MSTNHNDGVLTMTNSSRTNELGQPIGPSMGDWQAPPAVTLTTLYGTDVTLRPVDPARDAEPLQAAFEGDLAGWTYLPYGPFDSVEAHREWLALFACGADPLFFTIERHGRVVGIASYLRTKPADGSIEIGHVHLGHALQRTRGATEALTLMIRHAFELGYRRVEWKCDALNAPSRRAAQRLGLSFDGIFSRMTMYKGRNRDTGWYAAIVDDWPALRDGYDAWLAADNFDADGQQIRPLSNWTAPLLRTRDGLQPAQKEDQ